MKQRVLRCIACACVVIGVTAAKATAVPIAGAPLVTTGGDVLVTFESNGAGYTNELYLDDPVGGLTLLFNNYTTPIGTTINLGNFTIGTELVFHLFVLNTGDEFLSGAASWNPDGVAHAAVETISTTPYVTKVGFEDLWGGGDLDFDDLVFSFSNLRASTSPSPSTSTDTSGAATTTGTASTAGQAVTTTGGAATTGGAGTTGSVDEPQTLLLFGSALATLGLLRRKHQSVRG